MRFLTAIFALVASSANADLAPDRLTIPLASFHFGAERSDFNEFNPGIIAEWHLHRSIYVGAGGFMNSFGQFSPIAEINGEFWQSGDLAAGWYLGITHYDRLYPAGDIHVRYKNLSIGYSHAFGLVKDTTGVLTFRMHIELD